MKSLKSTSFYHICYINAHKKMSVIDKTKSRWLLGRYIYYHVFCLNLFWYIDWSVNHNSCFTINAYFRIYYELSYFSVYLYKLYLWWIYILKTSQKVDKNYQRIKAIVMSVSFLYDYAICHSWAKSPEKNRKSRFSSVFSICIIYLILAGRQTHRYTQQLKFICVEGSYFENI